MLAQTSGATEHPIGAIDPDSQSLYERRATPYSECGERGELSRLIALVLFVFAEIVLASLSFGVAAVPALATFAAGSAILLRAS